MVRFTVRKRAMLIGALCMFAGLGSLHAQTATDPQAAKQLISHLANDTVQILRTTEPGSSQRAAKFAEELRQGFDLPYLARLAVGRTWRTMSDSEKDRFMSVFADWIVQTQSARLGQYAGENFTVGDAQVAGDRDVMVDSQLSGGKLSSPVSVDWRVRQDGSKPQIIDVVIAGVSMVVTYRNEFQQIVQQGGINGLIAELEQRAARAG